MAGVQPNKTAARRPLPSGRPAQGTAFEIVHRRAPSSRLLLREVYGAITGCLAWGAEALGSSYVAAARVVLERKERLDDLAAERRAAARRTRDDAASS